MMLRRLVAAIFLPLALGQNCAEPAACAGDGKTFLGCDNWCGSLKGSGADACNNAYKINDESIAPNAALGPRACVWKNDKCTWSPDVIAECTSGPR